MRLRIVPILFRDANAFVGALHRHHRPVVGAKFCIAVSDGDTIRGVAIVGRPVARMLDDGKTLEVNRCCTDGAKNACSMLYGAARRIAKEMGYERILTYTLPEEGGASLRASGWQSEGLTGGGDWSRKGRHRDGSHPKVPKVRWASILAVLILSLAACSPVPETDVAPSNLLTPTKRSETDEDRFRAIHGSAYDPNSRIDREKMAVLQGKEKPAEVSVSDRGPAGVLEPTVKDSLTVRNRILAVATPLIGQTETHGANRSPIIDKMNRLTGVPMGSPYCASFNAWCYSEAKVPGKWPKSAWSPDWVKGATWTAAKGGKTPKPGDTFGIWFPSKGRVAHTGMIESWGSMSAITIEGNTSPSAEFGAASDRDGDGIWRKRRLKAQIHSVRDWIGE